MTGIVGSISTKTSNYTITSSDCTILADTSLGGFTLTLHDVLLPPTLTLEKWQFVAAWIPEDSIWLWEWRRIKDQTTITSDRLFADFDGCLEDARANGFTRDTQAQLVADRR